MKRRGFTVPGYKRREWEQEGKVYVYATAGVELSNVEKTKNIISELADEFTLPLQVLNGNLTKSEGTSLIENLIYNKYRSKFD